MQPSGNSFFCSSTMYLGCEAQDHSLGTLSSWVSQPMLVTRRLPFFDGVYRVNQHEDVQ
jgi:hypothetical protein